jgi:hypothetical protein
MIFFTTLILFDKTLCKMQLNVAGIDMRRLASAICIIGVVVGIQNKTSFIFKD